MKPKVCGYRVLIKPEKVEEVTKGGIIVHASDYEKKREQAGVYIGEIAAIGESAWYDYTHKYGKRVFEDWAKAGDRVLYTRYGGRHVEIPSQDGKEDYVVVNDGDVLLILEKQEEENDDGRSIRSTV